MCIEKMNLDNKKKRHGYAHMIVLRTMVLHILYHTIHNEFKSLKDSSQQYCEILHTPVTKQADHICQLAFPETNLRVFYISCQSSPETDPLRGQLHRFLSPVTIFLTSDAREQRKAVLNAFSFVTTPLIGD